MKKVKKENEKNTANSSSGMRIRGFHVMAYIINYIAAHIVNLQSATYLAAISTLCLYSFLSLLGNTPLQTLSILIANPFFTIIILMAFSFAIHLLFKYLRNHYANNEFPRTLYKQKGKDQAPPIIIILLVIKILMISRFAYIVPFKAFNLLAALISHKVIVYAVLLTSIILFYNSLIPHDPYDQEIIRILTSYIILSPITIFFSIIALFTLAVATKITVLISPVIISFIYLLALDLIFSTTASMAYDIRSLSSKSHDLMSQLYSILIIASVIEISIAAFNLLAGSIMLAITPYSPYIIAFLGGISLPIMIYRNNRSIPETLVGSIAYTLLAYFSIINDSALFYLAPQLSILLFSVAIGLASTIIISKLINKLTAHNENPKNNTKFSKMLKKELEIDKIGEFERHLKSLLNNILGVIIWPIHKKITSINLIIFEIITSKSNKHKINAGILVQIAAIYHLAAKINVIHYIIPIGATPALITANILVILSGSAAIFLAAEILMVYAQSWYEGTGFRHIHQCITKKHYSNRPMLKEHTIKKLIYILREVLYNFLKVIGVITYIILMILFYCFLLILYPIDFILTLDFSIINNMEKKLNAFWIFIMSDESPDKSLQAFVEPASKRAEHDLMFQINILIQTFLRLSIALIAGVAAFITMMPVITQAYALYTPYILSILAAVSLSIIIFPGTEHILKKSCFTVLYIALSYYVITQSTIALILSPYIVGIIFATACGISVSILFFKLYSLIKKLFIESFKAIPESVLNNIIYAAPFLITVLTPDKQKLEIEKNPELITHASDKTIIELAKTNHKSLLHARENITDNKQTMLEIISYNCRCLEHASQRLQGDEDLVIAAIKENGMMLQYASEELRQNKDIALTAIKQNGKALQYASKEIQKNKDIVLIAIKQNGEALKYVSEEIKKDKAIVIAAVTQNPRAIKYASADLKKNEDVFTIAIKETAKTAGTEAVSTILEKQPNLIECVNEKLQIDFIKKCSKTLQYASTEVKNNKKVVLSCVKIDAMALKYASKRLQGDLDVVMAAVEKDGSAIRYTSLYNNREIVMNAVKSRGFVLIDLILYDNEFSKDKEIVSQALTSTNDLSILAPTNHHSYGKIETKISYEPNKEKIAIKISLPEHKKTMYTDFKATKEDISMLILSLRSNYEKFIQHNTKNNKYLKILMESIIAKSLFGYNGLYIQIILLVKYLRNEIPQQRPNIYIPEECISKVLDFVLPQNYSIKDYVLSSSDIAPSFNCGK